MLQPRQTTTLLLSLAVLSCATASWVDPDSDEAARATASLDAEDDREYELVFSDEFEQDGRTFKDGDDPRWTALNKNDYTNDALHFYSHDNVVTSNGVLNITTERKDNSYRAFDEDKKKFYTDTKHIQSAMVQGWNKFCFTGGIVEFSAKLPGDPHIGGLWPALWMLGNLARATYVGSSNFMWPYSYNKCDPSRRMSQEINACSKVNHYGLEPYRGRGAPEIDVIEAMQGEPETLPSTSIIRPYQSASLQIAPGVDIDRPSVGNRPHKGHWYTGMEYATGGNNTNETKSELNPFFYGVKLEHGQKQYTYQADALSANAQLNLTNYQSQHIYRVEWEPPAEDGTGGYIRWYSDGKFVYGIHADNLAITGAEIPSEPMYMLMNTAVASSWGFPAPCPTGCKCDCFECGNPECACALPPNYCDNFPANFEIDYIRVYQAKNESRHVLGCSPKDRPTETFIKGHEDRYMEKPQKHPLLPIQDGGAACARNADCGSGNCASGTCHCPSNFTGPTCLAHRGFYEHQSTSVTPFAMKLRSIYIPQGLVAVVVILALGFVVSIIRNKPKSSYTKLKNSSATREVTAPAGMTSYQNQGTKLSDVTYCVIDGNLANDFASHDQ